MITFALFVISLIIMHYGATGSERNADKNKFVYGLYYMFFLLGFVGFFGALLYCVVRIFMFFG